MITPECEYDGNPFMRMLDLRADPFSSFLFPISTLNRFRNKKGRERDDIARCRAPGTITHMQGAVDRHRAFVGMGFFPRQ